MATCISDSTRWLAVSRRDRAANSSFFYGAVSTRIFCRPTCPGRLARRSNVVFFDSQSQASDAGYRPCKRCQPCSDHWSRGSEGQILAYCLRDLITAAETNGTPWTVEAFARELGVSGAHLHRVFKKHCHLTPKSFGASFKRDLPPPRSSPVSNGTYTDEPQLGDVSFLEWGLVEQQERHVTLEPPPLDDFGIEPLLTQDPSLEFLDILALEEFLNFDGE